MSSSVVWRPPGQLAWILSEIELGDDLELPGGVSVAELRSFLDELRGRLTELAFPPGKG